MNPETTTHQDLLDSLKDNDIAAYYAREYIVLMKKYHQLHRDYEKLKEELNAEQAAQLAPR